jgi:hypothetical protein
VIAGPGIHDPPSRRARGVRFSRDSARSLEIMRAWREKKAAFAGRARPPPRAVALHAPLRARLGFSRDVAPRRDGDGVAGVRPEGLDVGRGDRERDEQFLLRRRGRGGGGDLPPRRGRRRGRLRGVRGGVGRGGGRRRARRLRCVVAPRSRALAATGVFPPSHAAPAARVPAPGPAGGIVPTRSSSARKTRAPSPPRARCNTPLTPPPPPPPLPSLTPQARPPRRSRCSARAAARTRPRRAAGALPAARDHRPRRVGDEAETRPEAAAERVAPPGDLLAPATAPLEEPNSTRPSSASASAARPRVSRRSAACITPRRSGSSVSWR